MQLVQAARCCCLLLWCERWRGHAGTLAWACKRDDDCKLVRPARESFERGESGPKSHRGPGGHGGGRGAVCVGPGLQQGQSPQCGGLGGRLGITGCASGCIGPLYPISHTLKGRYPHQLRECAIDVC